MIDRQDCEFFYQHYGYSRRNEAIHKVLCGHCLHDIKMKSCKNCPDFQPKTKTDEKQIIDIYHSVQCAEKYLKDIRDELKRLDF